MASGRFLFQRFTLDPGNRQLCRDGVPVELSSRYLDALILLVCEQGRLVPKSRFLEEVWRGVPVTDEALTQCIRTLRRQLGDNAASPSFIETVPKHGYRFIAPVEWSDPEPDPLHAAAGSSREVMPSYSWRQFLLIGGSGVVGAGVAGFIGGLLYGFAGASQAVEPGMGAASVLLVLTCLTLAVAALGGAGVSFGIAAAGFASGRSWQWSILGGAAGGLLIGAVVKLLGLDAFVLLFGQSPGDITGAAEGALLGGGVGLGAWWAGRRTGPSSLPGRVLAAASCGGAAGLLIPLLGGRMMGGSLDLLAHHFPDSRLRLDSLGGLFGEDGFGPIAQVATGALEGILFGGCIVGAMIITKQRLGGRE